MDTSGTSTASEPRAVTVDDRNRRVYAERAVAAHYAKASALQPAEETLLALLDAELPQAAMLDLGVGGGRTTAHFAPRVKRYVGIDYSTAMLDAARARFPGTSCVFQFADARALPFEDSCFDIVLFAHNGIDYVDHDDRLRILGEVRRVLWPGGAFLFSTHNLERDDLDFEPRRDDGVFERTFHAFRRSRLRANNPGYRSFRHMPYAIVNDGAFAFRAATYHIRAMAQIEQLTAAGFERIRAFSGRSGKEIQIDPKTDPQPDPWIYFLCRTV